MVGAVERQVEIAEQGPGDRSGEIAPLMAQEICISLQIPQVDLRCGRVPVVNWEDRVLALSLGEGTLIRDCELRRNAIRQHHRQRLARCVIVPADSVPAFGAGVGNATGISVDRDGQCRIESVHDAGDILDRMLVVVALVRQIHINVASFEEIASLPGDVLRDLLFDQVAAYFTRIDDSGAGPQAMPGVKNHDRPGGLGKCEPGSAHQQGRRENQNDQYG